MPVMTVAMAYFIEGQVPTSSVVASLVVLSSGVAICVWQGQASGTLFSILLCTLSTLVRPTAGLCGVRPPPAHAGHAGAAHGRPVYVRPPQGYSTACCCSGRHGGRLWVRRWPVT